MVNRFSIVLRTRSLLTPVVSVLFKYIETRVSMREFVKVVASVIYRRPFCSFTPANSPQTYRLNILVKGGDCVTHSTDDYAVTQFHARLISDIINLRRETLGAASTLSSMVFCIRETKRKTMRWQQ